MRFRWREKFARVNSGRFCKFMSPRYRRCFEHVQTSSRLWCDFLRRKKSHLLKIAVNIACVNGPLHMIKTKKISSLSKSSILLTFNCYIRNGLRNFQSSVKLSVVSNSVHNPLYLPPSTASPFFLGSFFLDIVAE